jgi:hypothetical protein
VLLRSGTHCDLRKRADRQVLGRSSIVILSCLRKPGAGLDAMLQVKRGMREVDRPPWLLILSSRVPLCLVSDAGSCAPGRQWLGPGWARRFW